ncbi:hypothetical protein GALMADRAFT_61855 [Galerina marginata CBS 339.88]|uniref:C3H1-type domain-containing protein n=1 Tax=Galerina marginata (strain CBS 339.88) TaxID=685588 RepID=A0A067TDT2_GALM3|nr:hypothetical protein GALMADRAFT_61855 [Galerina marginata CBS 339.88]
MPSDSAGPHDLDRDRERERDREDRGERMDRGGAKQKQAAASSKTKDLSHVPCKFFKVGGCTAGSSCPFSHSNVEPGGQKETCTWFVKGNCKFGHKCALAHVLPGQSMAMDRKNKKAAQTAAAAAGGSGDKGGRLGGRGGKREMASSSNNPGNRLPLLAGGATAPTRLVNSGSPGTSSSGRPLMNMSLKATISPSAPAPPLKDTDFAPLEEMEGVHHDSTPAQSSSQLDDSDDASNFKDPSSYAETSSVSQHQSTATNAVPVSLPPSAPRPSTNSASNDFGPIGSPPNYRSGQPVSPTRVNGGAFSPGTSPRGQSHINGVNISSSPSTNNNAGILSSSPFSAPGTQSVFPSYATAGIAASLGSGLAMMGGRKGWGDESGSPNVGNNSFSGMLTSQLSSSVSQQRSLGMNGLGARAEYDISIEYDEFGGARNSRKMTRGEEIAVDDEDLEDFLPSSLNDLLTPEERSRRMSRSNSGQKSGPSHLTSALASAGTETETGGAAAAGNGTSGLGHRYSRSVPAPTLLGDIKSIWADTPAHPMPSSPPTHRGTPSASYTSRFDPYAAHVHGDEAGLSMSMGSAGTTSSLGLMSPSNASAAFLPGLHHHYMSAKAKQAQQAQLGHGGIARQLRGASNPLFPGPTAGPPNNSIANNYLQPLGGMGLPSSTTTSSAGFHTHTHGNTQTTYRTTPSPFDLTQTLHQQAQTARPIPSNLTSQVEDPSLTPHLLSPNARALQQHAPGQSLPQGLAAGYSRIHALPPMASPPTSGSFVPGLSPGAAPVVNMANDGSYGDWPPSTNQGAAQGGFNTGLESMFSRLSYSAATRGAAPTGPPPGLSRNVSGGRYNQQQGGPLSPLSGPVVTRDDDDLFDMDK